MFRHAKNNNSKRAKDFFEWYPDQLFYSKEREQRILNYLKRGDLSVFYIQKIAENSGKIQRSNMETENINVSEEAVELQDQSETEAIETSEVTEAVEETVSEPAKPIQSAEEKRQIRRRKKRS